MDDTAANSSPSKLQLLSNVDQLKKRVKDLEELYTALDEDRCQEIEALIRERDDLAEKVENLQKKVLNTEALSSSLSLEISSSYQSQNGHENNLGESYSSSMHNSQSFTSQSIPSPPPPVVVVNKPIDTYAEDYANLKASYQSLADDYTSLVDSFRTLSDEKAESDKKVGKMDAFIESLQQIIEQLRLKDASQEEFIERLKDANAALNKSYEELYKNVCRSPQPDFDPQDTVILPGMSLFDELEDVEKKNDSQELLHLSLPSLSEDEESGYGDFINSSDNDRYEIEVLYNELALARKRDAHEIEEMKQQYEERLESLEIECNQYKSERKHFIDLIENYSTKICDLTNAVKSGDEERAFMITFFNAFFIFLILFLIIYFVVCVHQDVPLLFFINPKHLNFKRVTTSMPPM
uniref:Uncharacterized protein n=1 Tax=Panagrolaimus sp. ES5 TaxID=591445 RepID=A0AC34GPX5_9BILA